MVTATRAISPAEVWIERARFVIAVALIWAGLHFIVGRLVMPAGLERPFALSASPLGVLGGILLIVVLWGSAAVATLLLGATDSRRPLIVLGLGLAIWVAEGGRTGGTMDDWLIFCNEVPGPPRSYPYWRLLTDYAYLVVALVGVQVICAWLGERLSGRHRPVLQVLAGALGVDRAPGVRRQGWLALGVTVVVGGAASFLLMGWAPGETLRGQVYFAVGVGMFAGVFAACRVVKVRDPLWFWPAPIVIGIIGLWLVAALSPAFMLREAAQIDIIPAWPLARPLPLEFVAAGLVGGLWRLRPDG